MKLNSDARFQKHEREKSRAYDQRVREIEYGSLTPLVSSVSGGIGSSVDVFDKRLAALIADKRKESDSSVMTWLRCLLDSTT